MNLWKRNNSWPSWHHSIITLQKQRRKGVLWVLFTLTYANLLTQSPIISTQTTHEIWTRERDREIGWKWTALPGSKLWPVLQSPSGGWALVVFAMTEGRAGPHTVQRLHKWSVWWDTGHLLQYADDVCRPAVLPQWDMRAGWRNGPKKVSWSSAVERKKSCP